MKKIIIISFILAIVFNVFAAYADNDGNVIVMRIASNTSAKADSYEYICESMFSNLVSKYTDGKIKTEYYPASQLGSTMELVEAVALGTVQSTLGIGHDIYANIEPFCILVYMPYLFKDDEHFRAFLETPGSINEEINEKLAKDSNVLPLGYIPRSFRVTITKDKAIRTPDDFQGKIIRSPEAAVNVKWLEAMGASPVTITWGELYTSLMQGAAQGAENTITTIVDASLQDIIKYCSETRHIITVNMITVNKTWFDSLKPEYQKAIRKAADEVTAYSWTVYKEAIDSAWKTLEEAGVTCIRANEIDFDAFQRKSADVYKYFVKEGYFTEDQYNRILNMKY